MNAKLLFVATVAVSLVSTLAMAGEPAPMTRAQVISDLNQASANGTLQKTDYDYNRADHAAVSSKTREQVASELAAAKRPNPMYANAGDRSRSYNQHGTELLRPTVADRAQINADVVEALRDGSMPRTDYEHDEALVARRVSNHAAVPAVAQRKKAAAPAGY